jgi:uncharacterized protein (TIGR00730 family)
VDSLYHNAARELGTVLGSSGIAVIYGGGGIGSMGALADGVLEKEGTIIGVIPRFMVDLEWAHPHLSELRIVDTMHQRKQQMIEDVDAAIALPGGSGTFEELFEVLSLKRLGLFLKPIVIVNTNDYFESFLRLMERCIRERFMDERHGNLFSVAEEIADVLPAIRNAHPWTKEARSFAAV